ncbi:hypothetical protein COLO4_02563, partial [Corchorus olitorius]
AGRSGRIGPAQGPLCSRTRMCPALPRVPCPAAGPSADAEGDAAAAQVAAVGGRSLVRGGVQFRPQVQGQAPGLLGFEHRLVLREDGVLEIAQLAVRRIEVRDRQTEPHAARFRRERADVERDGLAPALHRGGAGFRQFGQHGRVRAGHFVGVFDLRRRGGMQVGLGLPGLATGGQQAGRRRLHPVVVDGRGIARAQPALVHEAE